MLTDSLNSWNPLGFNLIRSQANSEEVVDPYIKTIFEQMKETPPSKTLTCIRATDDTQKLQKQAAKIVTEFVDSQLKNIAMKDFGLLYQDGKFHFPLFETVLGEIDKHYAYLEEGISIKGRQFCMELSRHLGSENSSALFQELIQQSDDQKSEIRFSDSSSPALIFMEALIETDIPALAYSMISDSERTINLELFAIVLNKMDAMLDAYLELDEDAPPGLQDPYAKIKQELQQLTLKKKRGFCALLVQRLGAEKSIELFHELIEYESKKPHKTRFRNYTSPFFLIMGGLIDTDISALVKSIVPYISQSFQLFALVLKKMDAMQIEDGPLEDGEAPQEKKLNEIERQELDVQYLIKKQTLCHEMASTLGSDQSLKLFKELITFETRNSSPQTLFQNDFTPGFLFMGAFLRQVWPRLSTQIAAYLEALPQHGIPQITWEDRQSNDRFIQMQKEIEQTMLTSLIENLDIWTQTIPSEVIELNRHLMHTGVEVYKNEQIKPATRLKFAYLPFFEIFFLPLFNQLFLHNTTIPLTQKLACDTVMPAFKRYVNKPSKDVNYIDHQAFMNIVSRLTGYQASL